jgi:hypothetical protein
MCDLLILIRNTEAEQLCGVTNKERRSEAN